MKICFISHSAVSERQQLFYKECSKHAEVLVLAPSKWGNFVTNNEDKGNYHLRAFPVRNEGDVFNWLFDPIAYSAVEEFKPDIIYYQGDVRLSKGNDGSLRVNQVIVSKHWAKALGCRFVLFFWENLRYPTFDEKEFCKGCDFLIAGNTSGKLMYGANIVMPQCGVDLTAFYPRDKKRKVIFVGRNTPEKGVMYIRKAYPEVELFHNLNYNEVPQVMGEANILVSFPYDTESWAEQWLSYSVVEGCSSGCLVIASNTPSLAEYAEHSPIQLVPMHDWQKLKEKIEYFLSHDEERERLAKLSVEFAQQFSNENMAKKLIKTFEVLL